MRSDLQQVVLGFAPGEEGRWEIYAEQPASAKKTFTFGRRRIGGS